LSARFSFAFFNKPVFLNTIPREIWLTDFNLNLDTLDKLPFEKVQNMISKNILEVHGKASNLFKNARNVAEKM
jgi:hypothetical protein